MAKAMCCTASTSRFGGRRGRHAARPQRRRQDHDAEGRHGHPWPSARARWSSTARRRSACPRARSRGPASVTCPEERGIFSSLSVEENLMLPPQVREGGCHRRAASSQLFPNLKERLSGARAPSSPAASSRCWRSAASCAPAPTCFCSTSRPRALRRSSSSRSAQTIAHAEAAKGFTIVLVEQNFRFAVSVADRHYVVEQGRVVDIIRNAELEANIDKLHSYLGV
jgi:ABC-type branched-subunit amino acid transport system ATPase component